MATIQKLFSDIDLRFNKQPGKGDIVLSYDDQAVIRSIKGLLQTNFYERPFQPKLGSNLNAHLFEIISPVTAHAIEQEIRNVIANFEPRAYISELDVDALPDQNAFFVRATFFIGNATTPTAINLLLERDR